MPSTGGLCKCRHMKGCNDKAGAQKNWSKLSVRRGVDACGSSVCSSWLSEFHLLIGTASGGDRQKPAQIKDPALRTNNCRLTGLRSWDPEEAVSVGDFPPTPPSAARSQTDAMHAKARINRLR